MSETDTTQTTFATDDSAASNILFGINEDDNFVVKTLKQAINANINATTENQTSEENHYNAITIIKLKNDLKIEESAQTAEKVALMNLRAKEVAAIGFIVEGYNAMDGNTTSDLGTNQSEDFMWRITTASMGLHAQNRAGTLMNLNDIRFRRMPHLVNGKTILSHVEELRKDDQSSNAYSYPDKAGWLIPIRNQSDEAKTTNLETVLSSYSSNYSNAVISIFTPNADNANLSSITDVTFQNVMNYTSSQSDRSYTQEITVPANTTILVMVLASGRYNTDVGEAYAMNLFNNVSLTQALATDGLVIDAGVINNMMSGKLNEVHQLFQYFDGITNWTPDQS